MRHFLRCNSLVDDGDPAWTGQRSDLGKGIDQAGALSGIVVNKAIHLNRTETGHQTRLELQRRAVRQ
jgi:hypothetical protein